MDKKTILSVSLALLGFFCATYVQAEDIGPKLNLETGVMELPEVLFPDGSVKGNGIRLSHYPIRLRARTNAIA